MVKKKREGCCSPSNGVSGCKVDAVVTVDGRGQMVLPKETRENAGICAGDKLAVISCKKDGKVCCISLVRAEEFAGMVKELLGPMMEEMAQKPSARGGRSAPR